MSLFPPSLWKPSQKDLAADLNPVQFVRVGGISAASTTPAFTSPLVTEVPADKILLLSSVFFVGVPGAAQFVTRLRIQIGFLDTGGSFVALGDLKSSGTIAGAVLANVAIDWQPGSPGFPLLSGQVLGFFGDFNAAANPNVLSATLIGSLIPRGNWQRT